MKSGKEIWIFAAIVFIVALGTMATSVLSPIEVRFLGTLTSNTTLIGARYAFTAALSGMFSLVMGRLAYKYGKRGFLLLCAVLAIIYPLLYAASTSIYQYMGAGIIASFVGGTFGLLLSTILQDSLARNKSRGKYIGMYYSACALMGSAGSFIGGISADAYGLRAPYYINAAIAVLEAIVVVALVLVYKNNSAFSAKKRIPEKRDILFSIRYILKDRILVFHLIIETAFGLYWSMKAIVFPLAIYAIAKSNTATGSVFAAMGIIATIVLPFAGHYVDKSGFMRSAKIGYFILGVSSLALAFSDTLPSFFIFASIFAIGEAINGPMAGVIEVRRIRNHHRSELLGFYFAHSALLSIISPLIAGALLAFTSVSNVLLVYSLFIWLGLILGLVSLKKN